MKYTKGPWSVIERFGTAVGVRGGVMREYTNGSEQDQLFMSLGCAPDNGGAEATRGNTVIAAHGPELLEALIGLLAITKDSRGVDGYHLNGAIAEWDEFPEVAAARDLVAKVMK